MGVSAFTPIPAQGIRQGKKHDSKASSLKRLSRIEGQVCGIAKMVNEDRYHIDVVTQISAVLAALRRVEERILKDHVDDWRQNLRFIYGLVSARKGDRD